MSEVSSFTLPEITDEDIHWAARLLGLPENAFHGEGGNDPRRDVLKSMDRMDVAACPGSGKTTLLVAKLAILANKWQYRTRGICVLSHTNAARYEIEKRLGGTAVGRQLLSYPHYIGTIHGFVDRFLALPWLRSNGYYGIRFNTEIAGARLWKAGDYGNSLPSYIYRKFINSKVRRDAVIHAHYVGEDLDISLKSKKTSVLLRRSSSSDAFTKIDGWKEDILKEGFASYEDTFAFGHYALKDYTNLFTALRQRFPILFIDEAQDNSEEQSKLLFRIFMDGDGCVLRQRFGDSNQAIYNFVGGEGATTDPFPNDSIRSIPDSHRFGATIANLAEPLAVHSVDGGLKGNGPRSIVPGSSTPEGPHTIFLFDKDSIGNVLSAYAKLLTGTFSDEELKHGVFTAVGQVHRNTGDNHFPRHIGHYWPDYDAELTKANPQPQTFVQYVRVGQEQAEMTSETHPGVEKIADGLLRLAGMATGAKPTRQSSRNHLSVLKLLETEDAARKAYYELLYHSIVKREPLTKEKWDEKWSKKVREIGVALAKTTLENSEADSFLKWSDSSELGISEDTRSHHGNLYHYPMDNPKVHIKVGSIHSVKGQTHTATLVLETYWYKHNLEFLKKWLKGTKRGGDDQNKADRDRLKLHYVAMSRPTHLLCLAMKKSSVDEAEIEELEKHGWCIEYVSS